MGRRVRVKVKGGRGGDVYIDKKCKCGGKLKMDRNRGEIYCDKCGILWGRWAKVGVGITIIPFGQLKREYNNYWGKWEDEDYGGC